MEENRNEIYELEPAESNWEYTEIPSESGEGIGPVGKIAIGLGIAAAGLLAGFAFSKRNEIKAKKTEKKIKDLEKQGYKVVLEKVEAEVVDEDEVEIEPEEN